MLVVGSAARARRAGSRSATSTMRNESGEPMPSSSMPPSVARPTGRRGRDHEGRLPGDRPAGATTPCSPGATSVTSAFHTKSKPADAQASNNMALDIDLGEVGRVRQRPGGGRRVGPLVDLPARARTSASWSRRGRRGVVASQARHDLVPELHCLAVVEDRRLPGRVASGAACSRTTTGRPWARSTSAAVIPTGPAPTTTTGASAIALWSPFDRDVSYRDGAWPTAGEGPSGGDRRGRAYA